MALATPSSLSSNAFGLPGIAGTAVRAKRQSINNVFYGPNALKNKNISWCFSANGTVNGLLDYKLIVQ